MSTTLKRSDMVEKDDHEAQMRCGAVETIYKVNVILHHHREAQFDL